MRRTLALLAVLALPASAGAKEIQRAAVCGPDGCQAVEHKQRLDFVLGSGGPPTSPPTRHAAFYRVHVKIKGDPERLRLLVAPSVRRVRGFDGTWFEMPEANLRRWRTILHGVRPFPAAKLPGVVPVAPPAPPHPAPPQPHATPSGGGTSWWAIGGIAAGALALLAAAAHLLRGRRPGPAVAS